MLVGMHIENVNAENVYGAVRHFVMRMKVHVASLIVQEIDIGTGGVLRITIVGLNTEPQNLGLQSREKMVLAPSPKRAIKLLEANLSIVL